MASRPRSAALSSERRRARHSSESETGDLREMANTARKRALSGDAQRVAGWPGVRCVGPFGARLSDSPIRLRVWLTGVRALHTRQPGANRDILSRLSQTLLRVIFGRVIHVECRS